jgi:hypothetical protein
LGKAAGLGVSTLAGEKLGEHVAEDRGSKKGIKALFKSFGFKVPNKRIGKVAGKLVHLAPLVDVGFAGVAGYEGYSACMTE